MPSSQLSKSSVEFLAIENIRNRELRGCVISGGDALDVREYFHTLHFIQQMYFLVYSNSSVRGRAQSMRSKSTQICFFSNIANITKFLEFEFHLSGLHELR